MHSSPAADGQLIIASLHGRETIAVSLPHIQTMPCPLLLFPPAFAKIYNDGLIKRTGIVASHTGHRLLALLHSAHRKTRRRDAMMPPGFLRQQGRRGQ